jgi:hypothetical protein
MLAPVGQALGIKKKRFKATEKGALEDVEGGQQVEEVRS